MMIEIAYFRPVPRDEAYAVLVGLDDAIPNLLTQL
jgi:hypothetical protein